jgi:hypothetical protein
MVAMASKKKQSIRRRQTTLSELATDEFTPLKVK